MIGNLTDYLNTLQATIGDDDAPREVKFTDDNGRVRIGTVTGTSVSSSVSVSTSTSDDRDNKGTTLISLALSTTLIQAACFLITHASLLT